MEVDVKTKPTVDYRGSWVGLEGENKAIAVAHARADNSECQSICYFIGGNEGAIKIGHSRYAEGRLKDMANHSPIPLRVLAVETGGKARELAYHRQFAAHRLHGEWFDRAPEILAEIERLTERTPA